MPRKGHVAVRVGPEGEEQCRLVVPVRYLSHPAFVSLLEESERVYGFEQQGPIAIPCSIEHFRHVLGVIDGRTSFNNSSSSQRQGRQNSDSHLHLPRFAGCFRA
ncbi:auxin-responsive protein SAUR32-like [Ananas comosus]|uniref:Auxin-responsive protein SAUR32 n=1 Tax=Ananas comosus TaxID=4615 RepID=A0A199UYC6_ANACO|nr:auxin-responsive protein SAUR32-like [Ananas comosus]OAY69645.1 Auxin-responsive protein SAUR32 [Ananas comosus]